jgi:hypothetical protein
MVIFITTLCLLLQGVALTIGVKRLISTSSHADGFACDRCKSYMAARGQAVKPSEWLAEEILAVQGVTNKRIASNRSPITATALPSQKHSLEAFPLSYHFPIVYFTIPLHFSYDQTNKLTEK